MAVAKIGVRGVVNEREEKRNERKRNCVRISAEKKKYDAQKRGEGDTGVEEEDGADEHGVG